MAARTVLAVGFILAYLGSRDFTFTDAKVFVDVPANVTSYEYSKVEVFCNASHSDPEIDVDVRWLRRSDPNFVHRSPYLNLTWLTTDMAGVYTCEAETQEYPPSYGYADMELIIHCNPRWDSEALDKFAGRVGQSAIIECKLIAVPDPVFYWQNSDGVNMSSNFDYDIISVGSTSRVEFYDVKSAFYGRYKCFGSNELGSRSFDVTLNEPGIPDLPRQCFLNFVNQTKCGISCYPGYLGGEEAGFAVYSTTLHGVTKRLDTVMIWNDSLAVMVSEGLQPNTSYTIRIFGENIHGESEEAIGLYIRTPEGPPVPVTGGLSIQTIIIICSVIGGVLLIAIIIIIAVCCRRRHRKDEPDPVTSTSQDIIFPLEKEQPSHRSSALSLQFGNEHRLFNMGFDDTDDRFTRHNSWGSFKRPKHHSSQSSIVASNPGFQPNSQPGTPSECNYGPYTISLNHNPGESHVGFPNHAYKPDVSADTSFYSNIGDTYMNLPQSDYAGSTSGHYAPSTTSRPYSSLSASGLQQQAPARGHYASGTAPYASREPQQSSGPYATIPADDVMAGYDVADPYQKRLSKEQPSLCGLGALSGFTPAKPADAPPPVPANPPVPSHQPAVPYASVNVASRNRNPKRRSSRKKPKVPPKPVAPVTPLPSNVPERPVAPVTPMPKAAAPINPMLSPEIMNYPRPPAFQPEVPWEIPRDRLIFKKKIGEGSFGEVWRAKVEGILGRPGKQTVAVKMLKDLYTAEEKRCLLKELRVMQTLQPHPNIISLLGCCTTSEPLCVLMEYAANGNLQDLLRKQRYTFLQNDLNNPPASRETKPPKINLTARDLTIFTLHVASGMEYIASRELLHRDLAARNVLVDKDLVCKVCDFGSARDIAEMREYETTANRKLPLRWMAPESLMSCIYSTHSDVWSFGVFLWEVVTLGSSPYPGMTSEEVMDFVQKGCRMAKPTHCSPSLYALMKDCWHQIPSRRPPFSVIHQRLSTLLNQEGDNIFVDQMSDNAYNILLDMSREKI